MKVVFDMVILVSALVLAMLVGCVIVAYQRVLAPHDNGAREAPGNSDVRADKASRHLKLTNDDMPCSFPDYQK